MEQTPIKYAKNPKKAESKSFYRYERYSKAKTVGQALALGSYYLDLLFDFEHGHLKATGGPKRRGLVSPDKSAWDGSWTTTDKVLSTMHRKWITWAKTFEVADRLGVDRRNLTATKAGGINVELHASRIEAATMATLILEEADRQRRGVTDSDMLHVLRLWGFKQNTTRHNVMPEGTAWVNSDTLGLIAGYDGTVSANAATRHYPSVPRLMCRWLADHMPKDLPQGFMFTSINVNRGYAAKLHRDGNNDGPSMIAGFGEFTGGLLNYWPEDDKAKAPLDALREEDKVTIDLRKKLLMFDGTRGHVVDGFQGERFTVVFFSIGKSCRASPADQKALADAGIPFPGREGLEYTRGLLSPPLGYGAKADRAAGPRHPHRLWPRRAERAPIVASLSEERIREAKEAAKFVEPPQEEEAPPEAGFVGQVADRRTLEDGRKSFRLYLKGASGRLVLAVTGEEEKQGSGRFAYRRAESFASGSALCTHRLSEVRQWVASVLGKAKPHGGTAATPPKRSAATAASETPKPRRRNPQEALVVETRKRPRAEASGRQEAMEALAAACSEGTGVRYAPMAQVEKAKAKAAGARPRSLERYAVYSRATTLGEAVARGATGADLLHDRSAGLVRLVTSAKRRRSLAASADGRVERLLSSWRAQLQQP